MALLELTAHSQTLDREVDFLVILPENTAGLIGMESRDNACCPTLYLLHGMSDDHTIWLRRTSIERYASAKGLAVVMPAADLSFYSNMVYGDRYWDFISSELPALCRSLFPQMSPRREDTFVAGLSMGGYGALKCGLRAADTFSYAAGLSSCADIVRLAQGGSLAPRKFWQDIYGDLNKLPGSFDDLFTAAKDLAKAGKPEVKFYMWCGTEDGLYPDNIKFKEHMLSLGLPLIWEESPGTHAWQHWDEKIQTVLDWLPLGKEEE